MFPGRWFSKRYWFGRYYRRYLGARSSCQIVCPCVRRACRFYLAMREAAFSRHAGTLNHHNLISASRPLISQSCTTMPAATDPIMSVVSSGHTFSLPANSPAYGPSCFGDMWQNGHLRIAVRTSQVKQNPIRDHAVAFARGRLSGTGQNLTRLVQMCKTML